MGRPSIWAVIVVLLIAVSAMVAAIYFAGTGRTPLAMAGSLVFVLMGGLAFELARRRST